jgi:hypothetical protein
MPGRTALAWFDLPPELRARGGDRLQDSVGPGPVGLECSRDQQAGGEQEQR